VRGAGPGYHFIFEDKKKHPLMSIFQHKMWSKCFALCMGILKDEMVLPKNGKCLLSGEELLGLV